MRLQTVRAVRSAGQVGLNVARVALPPLAWTARAVAGLLVQSARRDAAAALRVAAHRLDPQPTARRDGDGWLIELDGVPLARVGAGQVRRPS